MGTEFFAGRVTAVVAESSGREYIFHLDVSPMPKKLGIEQFQAMLDDIRSFDATLLVGTSSATMGFGREGQSGGFESLVQLARLRQHGPAFWLRFVRFRVYLSVSCAQPLKLCHSHAFGDFIRVHFEIAAWWLLQWDS